MNNFFNYNTLKIRLSKSTRTLFVTLNSDGLNNPLSMELLFELEGLLAWASSKVEISSILIQSNSDILSCGYNPNSLKRLTIDKIKKFTDKLQKINFAIMHLPQTVVVDVQLGAFNIASELATAADIRIPNRACKINFNHTKLGVVPCSGGISQLSQIVGLSNARNWILTGHDISIQKLESSGFIYQSYTMDNRDDIIQNILKPISEQGPVMRIQTKMGLSEQIRSKTEKMNTFERQLSQAALISEDWKTEKQEEKMPAKHMKEAVKLSLLKSDKGDTNLPN